MVEAREALLSIRANGSGAAPASALAHVLHSRIADGCGNVNCLCFRHLRLGTDRENAADRAHDRVCQGEGL